MLMITYKDIEHERLGDAPFIGALIVAAHCSGNCPGCFNQHLKLWDNKFDTAANIIKEVKKNPINEGIILGGLEWSEQPFDLLDLVNFALWEQLQVIVYTRLTETEFFRLLPELESKPIYVKFGEYDETQASDCYFSHGVKLATTNQYIKYMGRC